MKKYFSLTLVFLLVVSLLFGCGFKGDSSMNMEMVSDNVDNGMISEGSGLYSTTDSMAVPQQGNQKLVRKVWLDAETEDMDAMLIQIDRRIAGLSGYVEEREVYNGSDYASHRSRYANITIRIPADQLDVFIAQVSESANITSTNETTENITLSYVATQSRITALETEQSRLLELLAQAENMEDLLKIESRLTEVRTELEEVTSQLRLYDNMVDYGTVYLYLNEVREYTVTEEPETVWERIGEGFMESLKNLGTIITEIFVFFVVCIPYLIPVAVIVVAVIILIKCSKRKMKKATPQDDSQ